MKINPREKRRHAEGREKNVSPFLAWVDFHARFARSTIPEEKWGTTRSLRLLRQESLFKQLHVLGKWLFFPQKGLPV